MGRSLGEGLSEHVVALLVEALPPGFGGARDGTAEDLYPSSDLAEWLLRLTDSDVRVREWALSAVEMIGVFDSRVLAELNDLIESDNDLAEPAKILIALIRGRAKTENGPDDFDSLPQSTLRVRDLILRRTLSDWP